MNGKLRECCLEIVGKIEAKPLYRIFRSKVKYKTTKGDDMGVLSLPIIQERLENGEIADLAEFERQMELWFKLKKHNITPLVRLGLNELRRKYDKEIAGLRIYMDRDSWMKICNETVEKFCEVLDGAPEIVKAERKRDRPLSAAEMLFLTHNIGKVCSPVDIFTVCRILESDPLGIDMSRSDVAVDLQKLEKDTLWKLFDFLKEKFADVPGSGQRTDIPLPQF